MKKKLVYVFVIVMLLFATAWTIGGKAPTRPSGSSTGEAGLYVRPNMGTVTPTDSGSKTIGLDGSLPDGEKKTGVPEDKPDDTEFPYPVETEFPYP